MNIELEEVAVLDISDDALEMIASGTYLKRDNFSYTDISLGCQV